VLFTTLTLRDKEKRDVFEDVFPSTSKFYVNNDTTLVFRRHIENTVAVLCSYLPAGETAATTLSFDERRIRDNRFPSWWLFQHFPKHIDYLHQKCPLKLDAYLTWWAQQLILSNLEPLDGDEHDTIYFDVPLSQFTRRESPNATELTTAPTKFRVYLPEGTKECWDNLANDERKAWYVTGTPGIGKTVSTVYYLKNLLTAKADSPVVIYNTRKESDPNKWTAFIWEPDLGIHRAYSPRQHALGTSLTFLCCHPGHVLIIDMDQSSEQTIRPDPNGCTVVVSTPDTSKVGDYPKDGVTFTWIPAPLPSVARNICVDILRQHTTGEIELARKITDVYDRCATVGPIMRRILDQTQYEVAVGKIGSALDVDNVAETVGCLMKPELRDLSLGKKPHSYLLMITKRVCRWHFS